MQPALDRQTILRVFRAVNAVDNPILAGAADLASQLFHCPMAAVTLIDDDTQWLLARTGIDVCSTSREESFCGHALELEPHGIMVVENAATDPRFVDNPFVTGEAEIRFYTGALLTSSDGHNLGALCVLDTVPRRRPSNEQLRRLRALADLVMAELERGRLTYRATGRERQLNMAEAMSGVGHWSVDLADQTVRWSDEVYRIHGLDPDGEGPSYAGAIDFYHPDDRADLEGAIAATLDGKGPFQCDLRIRRADGQTRQVVTKGDVALNAEGKPAYLFGVFTDVTEQRAMIAEAQEAARVKAEFLANMSHELRTPLTSIIGFTDLAEEQPDLAPVTRDYIRRVGNAGQALLCLVNDILDFSKLEAGQVVIQPQAVELESLCRSTLELFAPQAGAKDLTLTLDLQPASPRLMLDPDKVRQVLLNLTSNAVKFTQGGGVTLEGRWNAATGRLRMTVIDTGSGIAPDKLDRLFQRFSQVDASSTRNHGGTGLGLAICKGLSEAMGGGVGAESVLGQGSRFWFEIDAAAAETPVVAAPIAAARPTASLDGVRVLVADDHPANRELVRLFLTGMGVDVAQAADGPSAVALASAERFDLILMDVRMPGMDGPEARAAIRARPDAASLTTPILAFTADASEDDTRSLLARGFDGVVAKPVSAAGLIAAVSEALAGEAERRAAA